MDEPRQVTIPDGFEPQVGWWVKYVLPNGPRKGEVRPAVIVRLVDEDGLSRGMARLQVFSDGPDDGLQFGNCPSLVAAPWSPDAALGTWHL